MKKLITAGFLLVYWLNATGQELNNLWMSGNFGSATGQDTMWAGGNVLDFKQDSLKIYREYREMNFAETHGVVCLENGELSFYTNGLYIANTNGDTLLNGANLNQGYFGKQWATDKVGYRLRDGMIILPDLVLANHYRLFHTCISDSVIIPDQILTTLINMDGDGGLGEVVEKNKIVYANKEERLSQSHFNAVRHANGRDWWLVNSMANSDSLMMHLYTPDSVYRFQPVRYFKYQPVTGFFGVGQCQFSPDGTKFASAFVRWENLVYEPSIDYYKFDRCTGSFEPVFYELTNDVISQHGVSFSADSRYLYQSTMNYVMRYDTEADDVFSTKDTIAEWDKYYWSPVQGQNWPTRLGYSELGPDGFIYLLSSATTPFMHVVLNPDNPASTEVVQHFRIPGVNARTVANYPNYTLGPEDSPCAQMLGPPSALFQYEAESLDVDFEDFSAGVPLQWHWDFGDGDTSELQHPQHTYAISGTYTICLTASNIYGSDTQCQEVKVETTGLQGSGVRPQGFAIQPNPARGEVQIRWEGAQGQVTLLDAGGRVVAQMAMRDGLATPSLQHLPAGVYTVRVTLDDGRVHSETLMVQ